jgi:hypothetical protein
MVRWRSSAVGGFFVGGGSGWREDWIGLDVLVLPSASGSASLALLWRGLLRLVQTLLLEQPGDVRWNWREFTSSF